MADDNAVDPTVEPVAMIPQYIPTQYHPEIWLTGRVQAADGSEMVKIEIHSSRGQDDHYMPAASAIDIGKQIMKAGQNALVGKHLILGGQAPPDM